MKKLLTLFLLLFSMQVSSETVSKKLIASFSTENLAGWERLEFKSITDYRLVSDGAVSVLQSKSNASASGLIHKQTVDITKYPFLNWRWRANKKLPPLNEQTKEGDDYVARVYIVVSDGWFFWEIKALNYVWSSQATQGATWPNAYAPDNTKMIALRTSNDKEGVWYSEKRNVLKDLQHWLEKDVNEVEAIAVMTDSDDSTLSASAMYGDIYFSSQ